MRHPLFRPPHHVFMRLLNKLATSALTAVRSARGLARLLPIEPRPPPSSLACSRHDVSRPNTQARVALPVIPFSLRSNLILAPGSLPSHHSALRPDFTARPPPQQHPPLSEFGTFSGDNLHTSRAPGLALRPSPDPPRYQLTPTHTIALIITIILILPHF
ncbi:hypothetical protein BS47DRAFT_1389166 [Hydnum rufescens UP504]|uniref:Uncharacterized protein n=1 Tax=Hydnum rufescens UP504 TaxID=1448309 RepID=A0A9P6B790_9AGAM|nr:hypothetical protein BS47DRAFT_1389166 [Hydnum rufescens UP504]